MCPKCGSDDIVARPYDYGRCSQTGYVDAGERFTCRDCGASGDADDLDGAESSRTDNPAAKLVGTTGRKTAARYAIA
jgi:hypothetical protein